MKKVFSLVFVIASLVVSQVNAQDPVVKNIQDVSVTVISDDGFRVGSGSGVVITRDLKLKKDKEDKAKVNFVLTAAHVVDNLRSTREVIGPDGNKQTKIEFKPAHITQDLVENGRKVGEIKMECQVLNYSESEDGHDLALLMLHKRSFMTASTDFYLEGDKLVGIGTPLYHMGSRLGSIGAGSLTNGIVSKTGQVITLNNRPVLFDLVTCPISPGSSGGGVFIGDGPHKGKWCGMVVRGADSTFGLIVPMRRVYSWAVDNKLEWVLDASKPAPSVEELEATNVEAAGGRVDRSTQEAGKKNFMLHTYYKVAE